MRVLALALLTAPALAAALTPIAAQASPAEVAYEVRSTAGSWQPLSSADLARTVEHAALEVLTRSGKLQLERAAPDRARDYALVLAGHLLDEAETYTVALTFGPGAKGDVPSLNAAETVLLGKKSRAEMLKAVEDAARRAAAGLLEVLRPALERAARGRAPDAPPEGQFTEHARWPWRWAEVRVPSLPAGDAAKDLYASKKDVRMAALRLLTSQALGEASPRHALERCALGHKEWEMRLGCLVALKPLARQLDPTKRVVIEAYRRDNESRVRQEASEQMVYFSGMARSEAIQAFLESASEGRGIGPLATLGDLPNLDLAIRSCLVAKGKTKKSWDKHGAFQCLELVRPVPHGRRRAILWRFLSEMNPDSPYYLEGAGEAENRNGTPWQRAVDAVLEDASGWDPELEEVLWQRYQRTLSYTSMSVLSSHAAPSKKLAERLLEVVSTKGEPQALRGLERVGKRDEALAVLIREKLGEMAALGTHPKSIRPDDLKQAVRRLEGGKR